MNEDINAKEQAPLDQEYGLNDLLPVSLLDELIVPFREWLPAYLLVLHPDGCPYYKKGPIPSGLETDMHNRLKDASEGLDRSLCFSSSKIGMFPLVHELETVGIIVLGDERNRETPHQAAGKFLKSIIQMILRLRSSNLSKIKETQAKLLQHDKLSAIGQLAAGIAHEINNPLGFIRSNLSTLDGYRMDLNNLFDAYGCLADEIDNHNKKSQCSSIAHRLKTVEKIKEQIDLPFILEDHEKVIEDSIEGADRITKIVSNLKKFSDIGGGQPEFDDINQRIESTLHVVADSLQLGVRIEKQFGSIPLVNCFPQHMGQVFLNLLMNAIQSIDGQGVIRIRTRQVADDVEIEIADNGCGIPEKIIPRIFDPFFTTRAIGAGVGLGLNTAYHIVQTHGGTIDVESRLGEGTSFRIQLPVDGTAKIENSLYADPA